MDMAEDLARLAARYGIASEYYDIWGGRHVTTEHTCRALLRAMRLPIDEDGPSTLLSRLADDAWTRPLPPIVVARRAAPIRLELILPASASSRPCRWTLTLEGGEVRSGDFVGDGLPQLGEGHLCGTTYRRFALELSPLDATGYHHLELELPEGNARPAVQLIITPAACYRPDSIDGEGRVWGPAVQLYGLRSRRNWGIGDFTDLRKLIGSTAEAGGAIVGVNPLHALFPHDAGRVSPYSPSSRSFINWLYLDVEAIPEYPECPAAQALVASERFQARLRDLRAKEMVDYAGVATAKREVVEVLYRHFCEHHLHVDSARAQAFRHFRDGAGEPLEQLARFDAIQGCMTAEDRAIWGWPAWPASYRDPAAPAVAEFAAAHVDLVTFHAWLQWLADEQLAEAARESRQRGLGIGLYVDLAVGANPGGAETWRWQHVFAGAHAGAPPDDFSLLGQDWGVPTFAPHLLREAAYTPLIELLRTNMRHTGALRIDHVMGLARLFWVPAGESPAEGTYVAYPIEELLGIVALESQRNRCLVIGEDLGTVPDGLRDRLAEYGCLSYRPLLFERDGAGNFKPPSAYPRQSLVCAGTHDLPTLAGMWNGTDLATRDALGMFPSPEQRDALLVARAHDRARLLAALEREALLPEGVCADPNSLPGLDDSLTVAIHAYLARAPAQVMMVQPEDVLGLESQANLPGSRDDQHPNWRRRLPLDIEDWPGDRRFVELWDALRREHRCTTKRMEPRSLLERLDGIARALEQSGHALALIGLGSVGRELDRLDAYSDLDFFAIVETGHKQRYLDDLTWLSALCPIAYRYANTGDGYKILFDDGIFCEFAVFEPDELQSIPFAPGRIVWKRAHVSETICQPAMPAQETEVRALDWLLGEALTNLLVGLARERRGEKLSAMRFIQGHAADRALELADRIETAQDVPRDAFAVERRFERRYPALAREVGAWLRGYEGNRESALAILSFLERHFAVNAAIAAAIRKLCAG